MTVLEVGDRVEAAYVEGVAEDFRGLMGTVVEVVSESVVYVDFDNPPERESHLSHHHGGSWHVDGLNLLTVSEDEIQMAIQSILGGTDDRSS